MSGISSWLQTNWRELSSFLVEIAFLIAAVWFARNILKTLRAFQEQIGALLRLTIAPADAAREALREGVRAKSNLGEASPYWLTPTETRNAGDAENVALSEPAASGPSWMVRAWHSAVLWMNAPMISAEAGTWHRLMNWLRTPAGT